MRSEATIHLVYPPDHSILEKRPSIGCDLAKMKPLRTPRADGSEGSRRRIKKAADAIAVCVFNLSHRGAALSGLCRKKVPHD